MYYTKTRSETFGQTHKRTTLKKTFDNRQRITQHIQDNPGIHLRRIASDLSLPMGLTQYHLKILQYQGKMKSAKYDMYRHYFLVDVNDERLQVALAYLERETSRDILVYLVHHSGASQGEIAKYKCLSAPSINWCMTKLMSAGIINRVKDGKSVRYYIRDAGFLIKVLRKYYPEVWNSVASLLKKSSLELPQEIDRARY